MNGRRWNSSWPNSMASAETPEAVIHRFAALLDGVQIGVFVRSRASDNAAFAL